MRAGIVSLLLIAVVVALAGYGIYYLQPTLADIRDVVVIVYGVMGVLLFTVLLAVGVGLFVAVRGLANKVGALLDEPVRPALEDLREASRNARAASEFYADHAVGPVIKTVAAARGARRGLSSIARLVSRGRKR